MADKKIEAKVVENQYVIPLRREWMKVSRYKRTARSVKAIKEFIAKHMKVPDRDVSKVRLDVYLNNEMWFRGCKKPVGKVKVKAKKDGDLIRVELVDVPEKVKFARARHEKLHKKAVKKETPKTEVKKEEKSEEEKKVESEKIKSVEKAQTKIAEKTAKAQKHTTASTTASRAQRKALKM